MSKECAHDARRVDLNWRDLGNGLHFEVVVLKLFLNHLVLGEYHNWN